MYWPNVRRTTGSSLGPNTISATTPMRTSSPQPTSKMKACTPRDAVTSRLAAHAISRSRALLGSAGAASAGLAGLGLRNRFRRLMLDRLAGLGSLGLASRLVLFLHALLEGFDALGNVAHQLGDLAPAAQQKQDGNHDDPVPNAQAAHGISSVTAVARGAPAWFPDKLGAEAGKNKDFGRLVRATDSLVRLVTPEIFRAVDDFRDREPGSGMTVPGLVSALARSGSEP